MTLKQIHYVITILETGSFNRAAEALYVAQPTLTNSIRELEEEIGITIFHRSGRGVTLTNDGAEFISYARQVYAQYETLMEKYGKAGSVKKKFGISLQHYSFAVKAFVEMPREFDTAEYEFAVRETTTHDVIADVSTLRSEIGIISRNDFNAKGLGKLLNANGLEFHPLIRCRAYVYLWKHHPLAGREAIAFSELDPYPCISFEQGESNSFYLAEEILSTVEYPRLIRTTDRATVLNLMVGLNGYTLCSGIICEELNGPDYVAVPFRADEEHPNSVMEIGYIAKKNVILTRMGQRYVEELKTYLAECQQMEGDVQ